MEQEFDLLRERLAGRSRPDIPVFSQEPGFASYDVGGNPIQGRTTAAESPVRNYIVPFSHNQVVLVLQCCRKAAYEIEQAVAARLDMSTVPDVVGRPIAFCHFVVTLVE